MKLIMKFILVLQMMLVHLVSLALVVPVSADGGKKKDPTAYALIPAYFMAALLSFIFSPWALWHIVRNWGSWKIPTPPPRSQYLGKSSGGVDREAENYEARRQRYIENLEIRIREVRADPELMLDRGTLNDLLQELRLATGTRHRQARIASRPPVQDPPVPGSVSQANRLQAYIDGLERSIQDLRTEATSTPVRGRLENLEHELRGARAARDRLLASASLAPAVPTSQDELQNNRMGRSGMTVQGSDTVGIMNLVNRLHHLATESLRNHLRNLQNRSYVPDVPALNRTINTFNNLFQGLNIIRANLGPADLNARRLLCDIQTINVSRPNIVTPQAHIEAHRAVIEGPEMVDNTSSDSVSEQEVHGRGDSAVIEGPNTGDTPSSSPTSEEENRSDTQQPIAAALLRSVPDHDATLDQAGPTAQHAVESEETIRAEATRQTAAFYTDMGRSEPAPAIHVQDIQPNDTATPMDALYSPSASTAALPSPTTTATPATTTATPMSPELDDALNEELYTDAYP